MSNIASNKLIEIFESEVAGSATFKHLGGKNPCHIMLEGVEFYVYIKNLSSAHFENPDVWRAQLTGVDSLLEIKESDALFVLLGYDSERDIYAAWNPHVAKQRIGTAKSPSFYSRLSWQQEVARLGGFRKEELKNDGEVLLFPRDSITTFMTHIAEFFPNTSEYVAMGSKRRSSANAAYKELVNMQHINEFARYLTASSYSPKDVADYTKAIRNISPIISNNRRIFLAYDSLDEYAEASDKFLALDEVKELDAANGNIYSYSLPVFINFLQEEYGEGTDYTDDDYEEDNCDGEFISEEKYDIGEYTQIPTEEEFVEVDYESPYIDDRGNLTCIANPTLIDKLRPDIAVENRRLFGALATVEDFYGNRFPHMGMQDWNDLFNQIDWNNPYSPPKAKDDCQRTTRKKVRVAFPSGKVVREKQVVKTLLEVVHYAGVENVYKLGIMMGNSPLITTEVNQKYANAFKQVSDYLYVNTCSDTPTKFNQIKEINERMGLNLAITLD